MNIGQTCVHGYTCIADYTCMLWWCRTQISGDKKTLKSIVKALEKWMLTGCL